MERGLFVAEESTGDAFVAAGCTCTYAEVVWAADGGTHYCETPRWGTGWRF